MTDANGHRPSTLPPARPTPVVTCPTCRNRGRWFDTDFGPFCSKRCRLVDLGQWFNEEHRISEELRPDHFAGYEDLPPGEYLDQPEDT